MVKIIAVVAKAIEFPNNVGGSVGFGLIMNPDLSRLKRVVSDIGKKNILYITCYASEYCRSHVYTIFYETEGLLVCPDCGLNYTPEHSFCSSCGTALVPDTRSDPACPHCEKPYTPGAPFCSYCGERLPEPPKKKGIFG